MERLTKTVNGVVTYIGTGNEFDTEMLPAELSSGQIRAVMNRLSAYEDTGLEPEEILYLGDLREMKREIIFGVTAERLKELAEADKAGRLIVLPCKAGDHVWVDGREAIVENFFGYETERYLHAQFYDNMQYIDIPFTEIGKTVFLTREEAEAALAGKGGKNE